MLSQLTGLAGSLLAKPASREADANTQKSMDFESVFSDLGHVPDESAGSEDTLLPKPEGNATAGSEGDAATPTDTEAPFSGGQAASIEEETASFWEDSDPVELSPAVDEAVGNPDSEEDLDSITGEELLPRIERASEQPKVGLPDFSISLPLHPPSLPLPMPTFEVSDNARNVVRGPAKGDVAAPDSSEMEDLPVRLSMGAPQMAGKSVSPQDLPSRGVIAPIFIDPGPEPAPIEWGMEWQRNGVKFPVQELFQRIELASDRPIIGGAEPAIARNQTLTDGPDLAMHTVQPVRKTIEIETVVAVFAAETGLGNDKPLRHLAAEVPKMDIRGVPVQEVESKSEIRPNFSGEARASTAPRDDVIVHPASSSVKMATPGQIERAPQSIARQEAADPVGTPDRELSKNIRPDTDSPMRTEIRVHGSAVGRPDQRADADSWVEKTEFPKRDKPGSGSPTVLPRSKPASTGVASAPTQHTEEYSTIRLGDAKPSKNSSAPERPLMSEWVPRAATKALPRSVVVTGQARLSDVETWTKQGASQTTLPARASHESVSSKGRTLVSSDVQSKVRTEDKLTATGSGLRIASVSHRILAPGETVRVSPLSLWETQNRQAVETVESSQLSEPLKGRDVLGQPVLGTAQTIAPASLHSMTEDGTADVFRQAVPKPVPVDAAEPERSNRSQTTSEEGNIPRKLDGRTSGISFPRASGSTHVSLQPGIATVPVTSTAQEAAPVSDRAMTSAAHQVPVSVWKKDVLVPVDTDVPVESKTPVAQNSSNPAERGRIEKECPTFVSRRSTVSPRRVLWREGAPAAPQSRNAMTGKSEPDADRASLIEGHGRQEAEIVFRASTKSSGADVPPAWTNRKLSDDLSSRAEQILLERQMLPQKGALERNRSIPSAVAEPKRDMVFIPEMPMRQDEIGRVAEPASDGHVQTARMLVPGAETADSSETVDVEPVVKLLPEEDKQQEPSAAGGPPNRNSVLATGSPVRTAQSQVAAEPLSITGEGDVLDDDGVAEEHGGFRTPVAETRHGPGAISAAPTMTGSGAKHAAPALQITEAASKSRESDVELHLSPEELGKVHFTMRHGELGLVMTIQAERPETLDLLRRNAEQLAQFLQEQGYDSPSFAFGEGAGGQREENGESTRMAVPEEQVAERSVPAQASDGLDLRM